MKTVWIDREGECDFRVTWCQGAQPIRSRLLDSRDAAEDFARSKAGKTGSIISTLNMTAEQWAAEQARRERARAAIEALR
jgi:hypothetical protein